MRGLLEISTIPKDAGWLRAAFMVLIVWVTSPNYRASKAFFASLATQSPTRDLSQHATPLYWTMPILGLPLGPCSACWLPWYQWLYMVILLPYVLVESHIA
jgi:hypothetical protein